MGGVCDPPPIDRGRIAALDQETGPIGQPPESAHAVELLCRDEVSEAPGDLSVIGRAHRLRWRKPSGGSGTDRCDVEGMGADIGADGARRIRARVNDGAGCIDDRGCDGGIERDDVRRAREGEDGHVTVTVQGVVGDAGGHLAQSFATCALLRWQRFCVRQQVCRVGDAGLTSGGEVEHPQAGRCIGATPGAQEDHTLPVRRDAEGPRRAEAEAAGPGPLPGVGVHRYRLLHGPIVPGPSRWLLPSTAEGGGRITLQPHDRPKNPHRPCPPRRRDDRHRWTDGALRG